MTRADDIRKVRRHRVELILLGMMLAKPGDREKIVDKCNLLEFNSGIIADCFEAVRTKDKFQLQRGLKEWGIEFDASVCDAVIDRFHLNALREELAGRLAEVHNMGRGEIERALSAINTSISSGEE